MMQSSGMKSLSEQLKIRYSNLGINALSQEDIKALLNNINDGPFMECVDITNNRAHNQNVLMDMLNEYDKNGDLTFKDIKRHIQHNVEKLPTTHQPRTHEEKSGAAAEKCAILA